MPLLRIFINIFRIIFLTLLAFILVACMVVFIVFQVVDLDQYLPKISSQISSVLKRPVSVGHLGLGISLKGITLDAGPIVIADDPNFTQEPFMTADRVRLAVDYAYLIFKHKLRVRSLSFQSPEIHLIRSEGGKYNIQSLFTVVHIKDTSVKNNPTAPGHEETLPQNISSPKLNSSFKESSLNLGNQENMLIEIVDGAISYIDQSQQLPLDIWIDSITGSLNDLKASFYSSASNVHLGVIINQEDKTKINNVKLELDLASVNKDDFKGIFPGNPDLPFLNDLSGKVKLSMDQSHADLDIQGVVLTDFNVLKVVLSQVLGSFGFGVDINHLLSGPMDANDTLINEARAAVSYHDQKYFFDDLSLQTNFFELTAKGTLDQDSQVDMQTKLYLNTDVSNSLIDKINGLKMLADDSGRIAIPASLTGNFPHLKYKVSKDFRKKSRKMLMREGGNILGALLGGF